ncbi:MAG: hypothetical protein M3Z75_31005 [Actinomycetota bacterium]|nr:hypothetical protein [Actinomycetota bacterium]
MRRFANAGSAEELLSRAEHRVTKPGPFTGLASLRWNEGVASAAAIAAELRGLGFRSDVQTVQPVPAATPPSRQHARRPPGPRPGHARGPQAPAYQPGPADPPHLREYRRRHPEERS